MIIIHHAHRGYVRAVTVAIIKLARLYRIQGRV